MTEGNGEFTRCLIDAKSGDESAMGRAFGLVYEELRRLASAQLSRRSGEQTLGTTALVHEVYVRLAGGARVEDRSHYFSLAARAMRQILVDSARRRFADKRGGGQRREASELLLDTPAVESLGTELLALDVALEQLARMDQRLARIVELRFFAGLPETEIADLFDVNERTVRRDWRRAKAWLQTKLQTGETSSGEAMS